MVLVFLLRVNLDGSNPDSCFSDTALERISFKFFLSTTLNLGHFHGMGREALILPVRASDEESQKTTQESMFNYVRLSDGGPDRLEAMRSEINIISHIASRVVPAETFNLEPFHSTQKIRSAIAQSIPGFSEMVGMDTHNREFQVADRTIHRPEFKTSDGKARFTVVKIPPSQLKKNQFHMKSLDTAISKLSDNIKLNTKVLDKLDRKIELFVKMEEFTTPRKEQR